MTTSFPHDPPPPPPPPLEPGGPARRPLDWRIPAAIAAIVALRVGRAREAAAGALVALACVAFRAIAVPDFGFGFDGLEVPTAREFGLWIAMAAALVATAAAARLATRPVRDEPPR